MDKVMSANWDGMILIYQFQATSLRQCICVRLKIEKKLWYQIVSNMIILVRQWIKPSTNLYNRQLNVTYISGLMCALYI